MMRKATSIVGFLLLFLCSLVEGQAYIKQCIIDDTCDLDTVNVTTAGQLTTALSTAAAGDKIALAAGTYTGNFNVTVSGTSTNPILIMPSGWPTAPARVTVVGSFNVTGSHNYIIGLELYGGGGNPVPPGRLPDGIALNCAECGAINNYIWDDALSSEDTGNGIGAWNFGKQIIYGNIIRKRRHVVYSQNDFALHGYKYYVSNYLVDAHIFGNGGWLFHAYTESAKISGYWVERSIFANNKWLIGGFNEPHYEEIVKENYFYNSSPGFGYARPMWFHFIDNYVGRGGILDRWHWGAGETQYNAIQNLGVVTITGNTVVNPTGDHFNTRTSAYLSSGRAECTPTLRSVDVVNNNSYFSDDGLFHGALCVGGINRASVDGLSNWRTHTQTGGEQFDLNSTEALRSTEPTRQFFIQNEYDANRGFLVVFNWDNDTEVTYAGSATWTAYDAKDPYGAPVTTGTNTDTIPVDSEFEVFLIVDETPPPATSCDIAQAIKLLEETASLIAQQFVVGMDADLSFQSRVRKMRKLNVQMSPKSLELSESLEGCEEACK